MSRQSAGAVGGWRPIESAPENTPVLVCDSFGVMCASYAVPPTLEDWWETVRNDDEPVKPNNEEYEEFLGSEPLGWVSYDPATGDVTFLTPTHWQPLPNPPPSLSGTEAQSDGAKDHSVDADDMMSEGVKSEEAPVRAAVGRGPNPYYTPTIMGAFRAHKETEYGAKLADEPFKLGNGDHSDEPHYTAMALEFRLFKAGVEWMEKFCDEHSSERYPALTSRPTTPEAQRGEGACPYPVLEGSGQCCRTKCTIEWRRPCDAQGGCLDRQTCGGCEEPVYQSDTIADLTAQLAARDALITKARDRFSDIAEMDWRSEGNWKKVALQALAEMEGK
jgi:hypothetical protein